ncbi:MAG: type III PLP-dependent enzyme [Spirochaetia bacterium]|nr:type III PLP-dependent enzyme [Spirochaetia bacterium]
MKTPVLLMNKSKIINNYNEIRKAFFDFKVAYAIKANNNTEILNSLLEENAYFETASFFEIKKLLSLGVSSNNIIFSNPVKSPEEIYAAVSNNITVFAFDSIGELEKIYPYKKKINLQFRIEVPNEGSLWPLSGKFGCPEELWEKVFSYMKEKEIELSGITFHVGSQCERLNSWHMAMTTAKKALKLSQKYNLNPNTLNIGGGFPVYLGREIPSVNDISKIIYEHLNNWKNEGINITNFYAEPGRFITGDAGIIVSKIIGIAERKEKKWVFLDTGVFTGMMETIDGITYPIKSTGKGKKERVMLCGPTCDSMDKMYEAEIPSPIVGDKIYFLSSGAYTTVYASNFNGFSIPEVFLLKNIHEKNFLESIEKDIEISLT